MLELFLDGLTGRACPLLDSANEFVFLAGNKSQIIIGEVRPLLLQFSFCDVPVSFDFECIHISGWFEFVLIPDIQLYRRTHLPSNRVRAMNSTSRRRHWNQRITHSQAAQARCHGVRIAKTGCNMQLGISRDRALEAEIHTIPGSVIPGMDPAKAAGP